MAAPKFSPVAPTAQPRHYTSPDHVPDNWMPDRPAEIAGFQPDGPRLGNQGPDQGFALQLANRLRPQLQLEPREHPDDAVRGCLGIALRRASLFSRAPVVHDLTVAFTMWGFYDPHPPEDLVAVRRQLFEGLRHVGHHYTEARIVADMAPIETLQMTPAQVATSYATGWRSLVGA